MFWNTGVKIITKNLTIKKNNMKRVLMKSISGISGDLTDIRGDLDKCDLTQEERGRR